MAFGQSLLLTPVCLEKSCLSIDSVDRKHKPQFCLCSKSSYALISYYKCSSLMGGLTSFLNVSVWCAAVSQMTQGKELMSPFRQNIARLLHDGFWQKSQSAVPWRKLPTDAYCPLCLRHVEPEPLEPAGPKEAWFILCPVKYALWTVCRPSLFININNPRLWPPAGLLQALSSVLPSDSIYLTLDLLASFLKGSAWDRAMLGARKLGSVL